MNCLITAASPSPAQEAGLKAGDIVRAIDGTKINNWLNLNQALVTGSGRSADGRPMAVFTIERAGVTQDYTVYPVLSGDDNNRRVGIIQGYDLIVYNVANGSAAAKAGVHIGDQVLSLDGQPELNAAIFFEQIEATPKKPAVLTVLRDGKTLTLNVPAREQIHEDSGIDFTTGTRLTYPSPFLSGRG